MLDEKTLADLRAKVEKATPGPWWLDTNGGIRCDDHHPEANYVGETDFNGSDEALILALRNAAPDLLALASFGLKAKTFLEEHGDALGAGLSLMEIETIEEREARDAARDALRAFSESARALTEAKGGK